MDSFGALQLVRAYYPTILRIGTRSSSCRGPVYCSQGLGSQFVLLEFHQACWCWEVSRGALSIKSGPGTGTRGTVCEPCEYHAIPKTPNAKSNWTAYRQDSDRWTTSVCVWGPPGRTTDISNQDRVDVKECDQVLDPCMADEESRAHKCCVTLLCECRHRERVARCLGSICVFVEVLRYRKLCMHSAPFFKLRKRHKE